MNGSESTSAGRNPAEAVSRDRDGYGMLMIEANRLEAWPSPRPERAFLVHEEMPEFTCLCPRSGFPDFAALILDYVPGRSVVELKSLKLYVNGFRDRRISHEEAVNEIAETLVELLRPRRLRLVGRFGRRGNIETVVTAEYDDQRGWVAELPPAAAAAERSAP
jgi:7-cyano-7-deazaguanine reductase